MSTMSSISGEGTSKKRPSARDLGAEVSKRVRAGDDAFARRLTDFLTKLHSLWHPEPTAQKLAKQLWQVMNDRNVFDMGHYLAALMAGEFRYGTDQSKGKKDPETLYSFDGIRYTCSGAENAFVRYSQRRVVDMIDSLLEMKEFKQLVEDHQKAEEEMKAASYDVTARAFCRWVKQVNFNAAVQVALNVLRGPEFYLERRLPKPVAFHHALDNDAYHVGFTNGVMEFKTFTFYTKGKVRPDIFVSKCVNYDWIGASSRPAVTLPPDEYDVILAATRAGKDEHVIKGQPLKTYVEGEILSSPIGVVGPEGLWPFASWEQKASAEAFEEEVYGKLFTDQETRTCVQKAVGALLLGGSGVTKKLFLCLGPTANNGKSVFAKLLVMALGGYAFCVNATILEEKTKAEGCSPVLHNVRKNRLVCILETAEGVPLNHQTVKALTGGDQVCTRDLWGSPEATLFMPKIWVMTNYPPFIEDQTDAGFMNRMYMLDFQSRFAADFDDDPQLRQFKAVPDAILNERFIASRELHMMLMAKYCEQFQGDGWKLPDPPKESAARQLLLQNTVENRITEWVRETYTITDWAGFTSAQISDEGKRKLVQNVEDVYENLRRREGNRVPTKKVFERVLVQLPGVVIKSVKNHYVGSIKKAVNLWELPPSTEAPVS